LISFTPPYNISSLLANNITKKEKVNTKRIAENEQHKKEKIKLIALSLSRQVFPDSPLVFGREKINSIGLPLLLLLHLLCMYN